MTLKRNDEELEESFQTINISAQVVNKAQDGKIGDPDPHDSGSGSDRDFRPSAAVPATNNSWHEKSQAVIPSDSPQLTQCSPSNLIHLFQ